jgi:NADH:ubiquinone oxidoreductase subunit 6 (subunit J)
LKKKTLTIIAYTYGFIVIIAFGIYAVNVADKNWMIDFQEQKYNLLLFCILFFIAVILTSIDGAGIRDKGKKIKKSTIYAGLSIAVIFIVWRILRALF